MSSREAAARSKGAVSRATIDNIKAGRHSGKIDDGTVDGLVLAFDVSRSEILRAMNRGHLAALRPFEAPERWQRLSHAQRKIVIAVGDGLLAAYEQGREDEEAGAERAAPEPRRLRPVARKGRPEDAEQVEQIARQARRDHEEGK